MRNSILLDTGPLVALLNRRDKYHDWAKAHVGAIEPPLRTCEAVLSEACFLVRNIHKGPETVVKLVTGEAIVVAFRLGEEALQISKLLARYSNVPMSLADACLVRMAETHAQGTVMTLDRDFRVYRKHNRQVIPTIMPNDL